jgi:hypothetical protein
MKFTIRLSTILFSSLILFACSEDSSTVTNSNSTPDTTNPTASDATLTLSAGTNALSEIDISWVAATDETTAQSNLVYKFVYSPSNNISTLADAETNGTVALDFTANITSLTVLGFNSLMTYYFNVIVKDEAGNKIAYTSSSRATACFIGSTLISMADGGFKRIDQIVPGDRVLSFDTTETITTSVVGEVFQHDVRNYLEITTENKKIGSTGNHPFYAGKNVVGFGEFKGFKPIENFSINDALYFYDVNLGSQLTIDRILSVEPKQENVKVYNLHIAAGQPTYFANGFAVHNK